MLNTFFFGYLSLKWRRLVRTLILLFLVPLIIALPFNILESIEQGYVSSDVRDFTAFTALLIVLTSIVSYILKPFAMNKNKFKSELYTFFFGYLSIKWRRLVRTLLLLPTISFQLFMIVIFLDEIWNFYLLRLLLLSLFIPLFIALLSWIIKPFVIKED